MGRVIYAWDYIEWGGAQVHFLALIREARKEFETVVVLPEKTDPQFLRFLETENIRYEVFRGHIDATTRTTVIEKIKRHWIRAKAEYAMLRAIGRVGVDGAIVHTDILPGQSLLSMVWLCARAHLFITSHNALGPVSRWRWRLWRMKYGVISLFDSFHVFCTNQHAKQYFQRLFSERVSADIKVTYDSIDPVAIDLALAAEYEKDAVLSGLGIPTDKFVVLAVGQFIDRKGRWVFLEAAKQVTADDKGVVFVWVTPQFPNADDSDKITSFGLGNAFHLVRSSDIGSDRQDILRFFRVADAYALPSYVEGLPISLLEAMAIGIPSISTNVYGIPEAIIDDRTGLLIEAGDPSVLTSCIQRLKDDQELRKRLSKAGRDHVVKHFDERVAARTAVNAYRAAFASENDR
jgi:glycosyltransferase involved in cell wall biosynthesis